ncbi:MAG: hypothetical protein KH037_06370 [Burkholderiales bacterium]|nr:hypothetical protein [Burkholderiales bacterium]
MPLYGASSQDLTVQMQGFMKRKTGRSFLRIFCRYFDCHPTLIDCRDFGVESKIPLAKQPN